MKQLLKKRYEIIGILGKGAVLTTTSYANRTSPVLRGAWLLENVLGTPPHPPPPGDRRFWLAGLSSRQVAPTASLKGEHHKQGRRDGGSIPHNR